MYYSPLFPSPTLSGSPNYHILLISHLLIVSIFKLVESNVCFQDMSVRTCTRQLIKEQICEESRLFPNPTVPTVYKYSAKGGSL